MAGLTPQATSEEVLVVLLLFLLATPLAFLSVGCGFEAQSAQVQCDAEDVGQRDERAQRGKGGWGERVDGQNGQQAQRDPDCLGKECAEEFRRRGADRLEA